MLSFKRDFFSSGLAGAWSFPPAVPLALLARPPERAELRGLAEKLRSMLGSRKISGTAWIKSSFPQASSHAVFSAPGPASLRRPLPELWGLRLDMPCPGSLVEGRKDALPFDQAVFVSALVRNSAAVPPEALPVPGRISFRAAALASMLFAPLLGSPAQDSPATVSPAGGLSFTWELDEPVWLPNPTRRARG
jgi:hypothetical protein